MPKEPRGSNSIRADSRPGSIDRLGFNVGLRGKGGVELEPKKVQFKARVIGPELKEEGEKGRKGEGEKGKKGEGPSPFSPSPLLLFFLCAYPGRGRRPARLLQDRHAGEYRVQVLAKGKDIDGTDIESTTNARFLIAAEDLETLRPAANHDFLRKLARAGGGQFFLADEKKLLDFLHKLTAQKPTRKSVDVGPIGSAPPDLRPRPGPSDDRSTDDPVVIGRAAVPDRVRGLPVAGVVPAAALGFGVTLCG